MNSGLNIILIAAMLVLLMAVPAAAAQITVDGNGSDWDPSWFLASDPLPDTNPADGSVINCGNAGYNLTGVWQHYNATEDRLYFMYNVTGIAGDSDGDGDPNNGTPGWNDQYGVGMSEEYVLMINTSPTGDPYNRPDIFLNFRNNLATVTGPDAYLVGSVEAAINTTTGFFSPFVEFSVGNVTGWLANPYKYSLYGHAGSTIDFVAEDWLGEIIYVTFPPVANFTFVAGDCNQTVWFDPSGSYDDPYGGIVNYTWDFGDGTGEVRLNNSTFSHTFPVTNGTYNVNLTVADTDGLTNSFVGTVMVNRGPAISSVTTNKTSVVEPGEWVLFEGWYSDPDGDTLTYRWSIDGVGIASGSSTTYSNASYFVNRTLTANLTIEDPHNCTDTDNVTVTYLHRPIPVINFTATGCLEVELNASESYDPDGHITNYTWDLNNDSIYGDNTSIICTANFSEGGNHTIRLRVTDNSSLTNTTTKVIYVAREPTANADANRSSVATPGGWVLFNGTGSTCDMNVTNSLDYIWTIHGATYTGATVEYYVTNTTTAFLNVTDEYGCTATDNVTVTYLHRPVPVINFTATGCLEVELNASESYDPDGNITNYTWDTNNDGKYDDGTGVTCTASFGAGGNYTVGLNVTDDSGLTNTTTRVIYVACKPLAVAKANRSFVASPGDWVLFNGSDSTYDMNVTNSLDYTWLIHGITYDDDGEGVLYYVINDTTAVLTVRDRYNCTDTNTSGVTIPFMYRPVPAVINFTVTGCLEVELNASESYDPDGNITAYEWDLDNDSIYNDATGITCNHTFSEGGNHTVGLRVTDNSSLTNTTRKVIHVACKPKAVARVNRSYVTAPGDWVLFNGSESSCDVQSEPLNYTWNIQGYICHNVTVPFNVTSTTTAVLTVRDRYGCTGTDNVTVTVHPVGEPEPVPVLTPAGILALIAIMCAVGAGRLRKGRGLDRHEL